jgi:hypothetical protein
VEQRNTGAEVAQSDGQLHDPALLLKDGTPTADVRGVAVMPQDFVHRVL